MKIRFFSSPYDHFSNAPKILVLMLSLFSLILLSAQTGKAKLLVNDQSSQEQGERGMGLPQNTNSNVKNWPTSTKRYALVIGVDKYQDKQITTLGGASNDAKTLSEALTRFAGFPQDQVILLASDQPDERQPTRGNILRRLSNLRNTVPKDGLLLISFAGHGMERSGRAFLLPADAQVSGDVALLEDTAINVEALKERIRETSVGQVVVFLDACRNDPSGRADAPNPLTETYTRGFNFDVRNKEVTAFATLYATDVGQRAYEYTEKHQGYFTWALVEGLKGAAANDKGEITLSGLVKYVQEVVPKRINIDLGSSKQQRPRAVIDGYKADELVISIRLQNNSEDAAELEFWSSIKNSANADDFKAYLQQYPNGKFSLLAKNRLKAAGVSTDTAPAARPSGGAAGPANALPTYEFETVTVSSTGKIFKRDKGQAHYLVEDLGGGIKLEMVELPGGTFQMGALDKEIYHDTNEDPAHQVTLAGFFMGKFEVTQAQWRAIAKLPKVNIDLKPNPSHFKFDELPVERITLPEAMEFCARLSKLTGKTYRLPSEAEWEYACRAGTTSEFAFGDGITLDQVNYRGVYRPMQKLPPGVTDRGETSPVGSIKVANAFGLYDMHGNVWEFCLDGWHENYDGAPNDGSAWESFEKIGAGICRGGSWVCSAEPCRSSYRNKIANDFERYDYGFRVVMVPNQNKK
ncbi:MAG: SUMF1/EgtB/PvdO family nonheme iron enzyme [Acidobacteriota bacterium]